MCLKPRSPLPHLIIVIFNLLDVRCSLKPRRSWNHEGPEEESFCSVASSFCQYFYSFLVPLIHFLDTVLLWHIKPFIECKELWVSASLLRELLPHRWDVFQFLTFEWVVTESGTTVFKRLNPRDNRKINASFILKMGSCLCECDGRIDGVALSPGIIYFKRCEARLSLQWLIIWLANDFKHYRSAKFYCSGPENQQKTAVFIFKSHFLRCEKEGTNYFCFCGTHQLDFHLIVKAKYFTSQITVFYLNWKKNVKLKRPCF